jgi:hypothetical protein
MAEQSDLGKVVDALLMSRAAAAEGGEAWGVLLTRTFMGSVGDLSIGRLLFAMLRLQMALLDKLAAATDRSVGDLLSEVLQEEEAA